MEEPDVFRSALSNFATDVACGGAIRHLTDIGYTLEQIVARLDYPVSREKAQRIMMEYLYQSRALLRCEPSQTLFEEQTQFVQEQDAYGRRTLRKTTIDQKSQNNMTGATDLTWMSQEKKAGKFGDLLWRESVYDFRRDGKLTELLHKKSMENGAAYSYLSCDYALFHTGTEKPAADQALSVLNNRQREYLSGIRWEKPALYHRLDQRMLEIVGKLYEAGVYGGVCFFVMRREKITVPVKPARN